jgi:hypothetical protein
MLPESKKSVLQMIRFTNLRDVTRTSSYTLQMRTAFRGRNLIVLTDLLQATCSQGFAKCVCFVCFLNSLGSAPLCDTLRTQICPHTTLCNDAHCARTHGKVGCFSPEEDKHRGTTWSTYLLVGKFSLSQVDRKL